MSDVPLQRRLKVIVTHINHPSSFYAQLGTGMMHRSYKIRNNYYKGYLVLIYIRVCTVCIGVQPRFFSCMYDFVCMYV